MKSDKTKDDTNNVYLNKKIWLYNDDIDLLRLPLIGAPLKRFLQWRGSPFIIFLPNFIIFMVVLAAGFFGNPTGAKNFAVAVVWILWFSAVEFMILFGSRLWCTMCPLPMVGEWMARKRVYGLNRSRRWFSLRKKYPLWLDNMWIAGLGFLGISLIVPWLVTQPVVSGLLFLILIMLGVVLSLIYTHRSFCRSICPANAYIGYHSNAGMLAVRSRDINVCNKHMAKECIRGYPEGYGCPWKIYPGGHNDNTYCGQCLECLKSCPLDNMTLKLRVPGGKDLADVAVTKRNQYEEAWTGFIRVTSAIFYELVLFGPFWFLKERANMGITFGANLLSIGLLMPTYEGFLNWTKWAMLMSFIALLGYPALFYAFSYLAKKVTKTELPTKQIFLSLSYVHAPYGMMLWIAFAVPILMVNWAYPLTAFSDPFGIGWNLFGTKFAWNPLFPEFIPYIQMTLLFIALFFSMNFLYKTSRKLFGTHEQAVKSTSVMGALLLGLSLFFVWIIVG